MSKKESFTIKIILPAKAKAIFDAWLDSDKHTAMTGGEAIASRLEGDSFSAWDGYIWGRNLKLIPNSEIIQSWRTSQFSESDTDSQLRIQFHDVPQGCELELSHTMLPEGQDHYLKGWQEHYFTPMLAYFKTEGKM
jgi:activator of HSP90 ATPase